MARIVIAISWLYPGESHHPIPPPNLPSDFHCLHSGRVGGWEYIRPNPQSHSHLILKPNPLLTNSNNNNHGYQKPSTESTYLDHWWAKWDTHWYTCKERCTKNADSISWQKKSWKKIPIATLDQRNLVEEFFKKFKRFSKKMEKFSRNRWPSAFGCL